MDEPNLDWTGVVSERLIKEAQEAGVFDNLPGAGHPLSDEALFTPAHQRFAARVLREAKVLPEWLELEREIRRENELLAGAKARLLKAIRASRDAATRARLADKLRDTHRERVKTVNTMVLKYNMSVPVTVQKSFGSYSVASEMQGLEREIAAETDAASRAAAASALAGSVGSVGKGR